MSLPVIDGKRIVKHLAQFNRKERFYLVGTALGNKGFSLSKDFRDQLNSKVAGDGLNVPANAFVAMDYHLDCLYASLFLASYVGQAEVYLRRGQITGTQEDIDLLVAYPDSDSFHVILLEAKGVDGFTNKQMGSKADRLCKIFGDDGKKVRGVVPHFAIVCAPDREPTGRLETNGWPGWMLAANGRPRWIEMGLPSGLKRVTQCDRGGKPKKGGTHWTVKPDRQTVE